MKHLGDITKINGHNVPLVDVVIGGSPCQDLSVAGQRKGLQHSALGDGETTRSGLFMEQIRIIKEMRDESTKQLSMRGADVDRGSIRPRYMVWENVPGAFSSNKGEDFRAVLEETCRIADKAATVPMPEKGKWSNSGCIVGDGWSVAWRVHDAQFWGVPQRRKRIALVADFGGESAAEILFERQSMSGNTEQSGEKGQDSSRTIGESTDKTISFQERSGKPGGGKGILIQNERTGTLSTLNNQSVLQKCLNSWDVQSKHIQPQDGKAEALYSGECRGGGGESYVMQSPVYCLQGNGIDRAETAGCNGKGWRENESYTLNTIDRPAVVTFSDTASARLADDGPKGVHSQMMNNPEDNFVIQKCFGVDCYNQTVSEEQTMPIRNKNADSDHVPCVTYGLDRASFNQGKNAKYDFSVQEEIAQPIVARGPGGVLKTQ